MNAQKPLAIDLFCGLGGWTEGLLAEGWDVIGFDIQQHLYVHEKVVYRYPAQLVVQDVLTLDGSQFRDAALIVASPPCAAWFDKALDERRKNPTSGSDLFGLKGDGETWFGPYRADGTGTRNMSSGSNKRRFASAMIAKIPLPLSRFIGATFK